MTQNDNIRDTIIEEIHQTRERMAEKFGGDIAAILEDARVRQAASGRLVWQGPVRKNPPRQATEGPSTPQAKET